MLRLKKRKRLPGGKLFRMMRKWDPRRCAESGMTEKRQIPWPAPWDHKAKRKDFIKPTRLPLEIDHINSLEYDNRTGNLQWLSRVYHIEKGLRTLFIQRKKRKGPL